MNLHLFQLTPDPTTHTVQTVGNVVSGSAVILAWVGLATDIIPVFLATLVSIAALVFYSIQIYESSTMRRWRNERRLRKIAKLKARVVGLEAHVIFDEAMKLRLPAEVTSKPEK